MQALLLGAGASYDCGFPLVNELTTILKSRITSLLNKNNHNCNNPKIRKIITELFNTDMHYEAMIGYLEVLHNHEHNVDFRKELHSAIAFFIQALHYILLENYQIRQTEYCLKILDAFRGIKHLMMSNQPLWIFSLNHDLVVEMLANLLDIELKTGFFDATPIVFNSYIETNNLLFENLTRVDINLNRFNFFSNNESGINLLKLHGALDIFAYGDELNYRKVKLEKNDPKSGTKLLKSIAEVNQQIVASDKINTLNESVFLDKQKQIQFSRHSLLSGAHKFSPNLSQIAPPEFLALFRLNINYMNELICIGYSFGDNHINEILKNWLSCNNHNLTIVDPHGKIPVFLTHLTPRITIVKKRATEYFMELSMKHGDPTIYKIKPIIDIMNRARDIAKDNFLQSLFSSVDPKTFE